MKREPLASMRPLRKVFRSRPEEPERFDRVWARIERGRPARRTRVRVGGFALAAVLLSVGLLILGQWLGPSEVSAPASDDGALHDSNERTAPLRMEAGAVPAELASGTTVRFADGSWVRSSQRARADVVVNDGSDFGLRVAVGELEIDVPPGGPRRWTVDLDGVTVRVVGTRFVVSRTSATRSVRVLRGQVVVDGPLVAAGPRALHAGDSFAVDSLVVDSPAVDTPEPRAPDPAQPTPARVDAPPLRSPNRATAADTPDDDWRALAQVHEYARAWDVIERRGGMTQAVAEARGADLLRLADVARQSGNANAAIAPLTALVAHHSSEPDAALGAFTLGRLHASRGAHEAAAGAFARAVELRLPAPLESDALARWAEALAATGETVAAADVAARYLDAHPQGTWAGRMRELMPPR
jgi:transmembrane sensor